MASPKKDSAKKDGKKRRRTGKRGFATFIGRVNKATNKGASMSKRAVKILNSFAMDMFDRLASSAASVCRQNKTGTLTSGAIQTAVRCAFPGDLAKHSISEASKAVSAHAAHMKKLAAKRPKKSGGGGGKKGKKSKKAE